MQTKTQKRLVHVSCRVFVLVYVGESPKSVHCATLHVRDSRGWECHNLDVITIVFFLYILFIFNCIPFSPYNDDDNHHHYSDNAQCFCKSSYSNCISGLVVEYIVAIDVTRVQFPADAV